MLMRSLDYIARSVHARSSTGPCPAVRETCSLPHLIPYTVPPRMLLAGECKAEAVCTHQLGPWRRQLLCRCHPARTPGPTQRLPVLVALSLPGWRHEIVSQQLPDACSCCLFRLATRVVKSAILVKRNVSRQCRMHLSSEGHQKSAAKEVRQDAHPRSRTPRP